jgi:hypothetical protein
VCCDDICFVIVVHCKISVLNLVIIINFASCYQPHICCCCCCCCCFCVCCDDICFVIVVRCKIGVFMRYDRVIIINFAAACCYA